MKKLLQILLMALAFSSPAVAENTLPEPMFLSAAGQETTDASTAQDSKPSKASIRHLLEITNAKKNFENILAQIDWITESSMKEMLSDQDLSPEKEEAIHTMRTQMAAFIEEEMNWEWIEAMSIDIYEKAFSQEEMDSMLSFYGSPEGQAVLEKMPIVMHLAMQNTHAQMNKLIKKLQDLQNETASRLNSME